MYAVLGVQGSARVQYLEDYDVINVELSVVYLRGLAFLAWA